MELYLYGSFNRASCIEAFPRMEFIIFDHEAYSSDFILIKKIKLDNPDIDRAIVVQEQLIQMERERQQEDLKQLEENSEKL